MFNLKIWFLFLLSLFYFTPAFSATFIVKVTGESRDVTVGDGICANSVGKCSLRAAVMEANAYSGNDTIMLADKTYPLSFSATTDDDVSVKGDLDITESVTITGVSGGSTTIDGSGFTDKDGDTYTHRVFHITSTASSVTFKDLTIKGGM